MKLYAGISEILDRVMGTIAGYAAGTQDAGTQPYRAGGGGHPQQCSKVSC